MLSIKYPIFAILGTGLLIAGCGTPGAPQPPSLRLPQPIEDLRAVRKGDKVILTWTAPANTTDGDAIRLAGKTRVCRGFRSQATGGCPDVVVEFPAGNSEMPEVTDDLTALIKRSGPTDYATYSIEVFNGRNKSAGPSNAATIFLAPSAAHVTKVAAQLKADAIVLSWQMPAMPATRDVDTRMVYRVERRAAGAEDAVVLAKIPAGSEAMRSSFEDRNFEWQKQYQYRVVGQTSVVTREGKVLAEFDGEDSQTVNVMAEDRFPPAVPSGLQAVHSGVEARSFIDLSWEPGAESDIAGYKVFRRNSSGGEMQLISKALLVTPSFRDENVKAGATYTYAVMAVDARGNQSEMSASASETVPEQP